MLKWIINCEHSHSQPISEGSSQIDKLIAAGTGTDQIKNVLADFGTGSLPAGMKENKQTQAVAADIRVISAMVRTLQQMLGIVVAESKEDSKKKLPKIKIAEQAFLLSAKALGSSKLGSDPVEREKTLDGLVEGVLACVRDSVSRDACRSYWQRLKTKFQSLSLPAEVDAQQGVIDAALEAVERPTAVVMTVQNSSVTAVRETKEGEQKQSVDSSSSETTGMASLKTAGGDLLSTTPISNSSTMSAREVIVETGEQPSTHGTAGDKKAEELAQAGKGMLLAEATVGAELEHFTDDWWWDRSLLPGSSSKLTRQNATAGSLLSGPSSFFPLVEGVTSVKAYFASSQGGNPPSRSF